MNHNRHIENYSANRLSLWRNSKNPYANNYGVLVNQSRVLVKTIVAA